MIFNGKKSGYVTRKNSMCAIKHLPEGFTVAFHEVLHFLPFSILRGNIWGSNTRKRSAMISS